MKQTTLSIIIISVFLLMSCSKETDTLSSFNEAAAPDFSQLSGEEMYKSIFLLKGDLALNIRHLKESKKYLEMTLTGLPDYEEKKQALREFEEELISDIKNEYPSFFKKFKTKLNSGNPIEVRSAVTIGGEIMKDIMSENSVYVKSVLETIELSDDKNIAGINVNEAIRKDGTVDVSLLTSLLSDAEKNSANQFINSANTLSNFGMNNERGINGNVIVCASQVAAIVVAVTVAVALSYAVAVNVGVAINAGAVVNVTVEVAMANDDEDPKRAVGGGSCRSSALQTAKDFKNDQASKLLKRNKQCEFEGGNQITGANIDGFIVDLTETLNI